MRIPFRVLSAPAALLALAACASTQLNYNVKDLASSAIDLITGQVLDNLGRYAADPNALPSQVAIPSGSATTTNTITPSFNLPIGAQSTAVLANSAVAPLFFASSRTHVHPNGTAAVSASDQWNQNWALSPLSDPDQLRRLQALYRFGVGATDGRRLMCEYPIQQKAADPAPAQDDAKPARPSPSYVFPPEVARFCAAVRASSPDPAFLHLPGCVICDLHPGAAGDGRATYLVDGQLKESSTTVEIARTSVADLDTLVGLDVTGPCLSDKTIVAATTSSPPTLKLNYSAKCSPAGPRRLTIKGESRAPAPHMLQLNPRLRNDWLAVGPETAGVSSRLGEYHGVDLFLTSRPGADRAFSDFVLFVLESALQGSSSGGASGTLSKGSPQKSGAPVLLQAPAQPTFIIQ